MHFQNMAAQAGAAVDVDIQSRTSSPTRGCHEHRRAQAPAVFRKQRQQELDIDSETWWWRDTARHPGGVTHAARVALPPPVMR
jgi:hypothetical protein